MLQGCWHLEHYFQSYFTYAFKIYLMKNKNQLEDGLIGVPGKADDLLSAMRTGNRCCWQQRWRKERVGTDTCAVPRDRNPSWAGTLSKVVTPQAVTPQAVSPQVMSPRTPMTQRHWPRRAMCNTRVPGKTQHHLFPWLLVTCRKPAGKQGGLANAAWERTLPSTSGNAACHRNAERGKRNQSGGHDPNIF